MKKLTTAIAASVAATAALAPGAGLAKSTDVVGTTSCSTGVKAKLKAGIRNAGVNDQSTQIKVQLDVDDRAAGTWRATANGVAMPVAVAGNAGNGFVTQFVLFLPDRAGSDTITIAASATGRSCTGSVTV